MTNAPRPYAREHKGGQPQYLHPAYASTVKRAPKRGLVRLEHTLSEVTGPTFTSGWAGADVASRAMEDLRALFQQKLGETREQVARFQQLERELREGLAYLETCRECSTPSSTTACRD